MKRKHIMLFLLLFAGCLMLLPGSAKSQNQAKPAKQKPVPAVQEPEEPYTIEEYDEHEKATKEPDPDKRAALLFAFIEKYPKSKLMLYIDQSYQALAYWYSNNQKWNKLEPLAEQWLKLHPDDLQTIVYIADAAQHLGNDQKFLQYGEKIYALKPTAGYAYYISQSYKKLGNEAKYLEWTEKLFAYPEYAGEFLLRMVFVEKYQKENKLDKAAEYALLTLKSLEAAKKPDSTPDADWKKNSNAVRRTCYWTIGLNYYTKEKWNDTIKSLRDALKAEKFGPAYYYIGLSQWKMDKIEDAIVSFAKVVLLKGEFSSQAKEHLENLYKAIHNKTTIGIDKVYNKAKEELDQEK